MIEPVKTSCDRIVNPRAPLSDRSKVTLERHFCFHNGSSRRWLGPLLFKGALHILGMMVATKLILSSKFKIQNGELLMTDI